MPHWGTGAPGYTRERIGTSRRDRGTRYWYLTEGPDVGTSQRVLLLVPHRGPRYWYLTEPGPDIGTSQSPAHDRVPHTGLAVSVRLSRSDPCFARDTAPRPAGILSTSALPWLEQASLLGLLAKIKV